MIAPSFSHFFNSCYLSHTYLPPVDITNNVDNTQYDNNSVCPIEQLYEEDNNFKKIFSEKLYSNPIDIREIEKSLRLRGFQALRALPLSKIETYVSHLQDKFQLYERIEAKSDSLYTYSSLSPLSLAAQVGLRIIGDKEEIYLSQEESLLRFEMRKRIQSMRDKENIDLYLPPEKIIPSHKSGKDLYILSDNSGIYSRQETIDILKGMDPSLQERIARAISQVVIQVGISHASLDAFRFKQEQYSGAGDRVLALIDTRPHGLLTDIHSPYKSFSVEVCGRVGLKNLIDDTEGLAIQSYFKKEYEKIEPRLSRWKIALSIASFGLLAGVYAIISLIKYSKSIGISHKIRYLNQKIQNEAAASIEATSKSYNPSSEEVVMKNIYENRLIQQYSNEKFRLMRELISL